MKKQPQQGINADIKEGTLSDGSKVYSIIISAPNCTIELDAVSRLAALKACYCFDQMLGKLKGNK